MNAGRELKVIRAKAGLTQAELAERLGITREHVSDIERGKSKGSIVIWLRIADIAGIEGEELTALLKSIYDKDLKEAFNQKGAQV